MDLGALNHADFAARLGDTFRVVAGDVGVVELELTEAKQAAGEHRPDNAFSILFRGPPDRFLAQGIHDLEHEALGTLPIFLVPIAETEDGFLYEAVFTRLEKHDAPKK